jgi:xanthine dehydrogenase accessory factor
MNHATDIHDLISTMKASGKPFALATVVRTVAATAAKAGAKPLSSRTVPSREAGSAAVARAPPC